MNSELAQFLEIWMGDESHDEAEIAGLLAKLREEPEFRKAVVEEISMLGKLRVVHGAEPRWLKLNDRLGGDPASADEVFEEEIMNQFAALTSERSGTRRTSRLQMVLAAGLILALVAGLLAWGNRGGSFEAEHSGSGEAFSTESREASPLVTDVTTAVLSRATGAVWGGEEIVTTGENLGTRVLTLESGLAQIDFFGGAQLIVEAPARFEILSPSEVVLKSGAVTCQIGELGNAFHLVTETLQIAEREGTFSVRVQDAGASEVQVILGALEIRGGPVKAQEAVRFTGDDRVPIDFSLDRFPRADEFRFREEQYAAGRLAMWKREAGRLSRDPGVLLHYTMEGQSPAGPTLKNHAQPAGPSRASDGMVLGASWTEGRWLGKSAIHFSNEEDRLLSKLPGSFSEVTFLLWARIDALTQDYSALIMAERPERWAMNGAVPYRELQAALDRRVNSASKIVRWTASRENEAIHFNVGFRRGKDGPLTWQTHRSQPGLVRTRNWGDWACYALTYEQTSARVIHYLNGEEVGRSEVERPVPLPLDFLEIGNLSTSSGEAETGVRYRFYGAMDEIVIAKRAFRPDEIAAIYRGGAP